MEMTAAIQNIVAVALGVLAIIWNQQRSLGNLRRELHDANKELRREFHEANPQLRQEFQDAYEELGGAVARNGESLARIEGHLGIGVSGPGPPSLARTGRAGAHTDEALQTRQAATG